MDTADSQARRNAAFPRASVRPSRRRFLQLATLGVSWPVALPLPTRGAESPSTAARPGATKIKLGLVGGGGRGSWIARLFQRHGGYVIHGVADYFPEVAENVGRSLGVDPARCFSGLSGHRRLYESGVEAVALETPPWFLPAQARAAVDAGLHVYMAKPVGVDVPGCLEVERAADKARANQRAFLVDYQMPTDPHNQRVVAMIHGGDVGRVVALNSHYYAGQFADPPLTDTVESRLRSLIWVNDVALGGGYHVNACIHAVDAALWVAGSPADTGFGFFAGGPPGPARRQRRRVLAGLRVCRRHALEPSGQTPEQPDRLRCGVRSPGGERVRRDPVWRPRVSEGARGGLPGGGAGALRGRRRAQHRPVLRPGRGAATSRNPTVPRAIDGALATILGREAGRRRGSLTMEQLLRENTRLELNLKGLKT